MRRVAVRLFLRTLHRKAVARFAMHPPPTEADGFMARPAAGFSSGSKSV
jgi:hypothetical protein